MTSEVMGRSTGENGRMMQRRRFTALAAIVALALVAAACGDDDDTEAGGDGGAGGGDFTACQVTDTGGVDDKSFNQTAYKGIEDAADELGFEPDYLESQTEADFAPNIDAYVSQGCDLIVTVGFLLGDATAAAAEANPDQLFAIVDNDLFDTAAEEDRNYDNVAELVFSTDQAAFLAGYVSAAMSETGTVGTYGGINIPTVNIFMKGFQLGVEQYNEDNGTDVELIGWDNANPDGGLFTGDFEDEAKGRATTQSLLDQQADVIMPVAGPVGQGTIAAIEAAGSDAKVVWVDTDGCVSVEESCDLFLTSVMKNMDVAVYDTAIAAAEDEFEGGTNLGTLENDGVGIAPFHEFEDEVPDEVKERLEELRQGIIDGEIQTSPDA
ncbi:MAG: BMP family ABC transporter substrate-binding protein [Acidimicrobiales bacterium]|nr:BMP family ABC transporter substrate-binding protein [Acidimicrobiales bacterium]